MAFGAILVGTIIGYLMAGLVLVTGGSWLQAFSALVMMGTATTLLFILRALIVPRHGGCDTGLPADIA